MLGGRRLGGAHGIGCRKAAHQSAFKILVGLPVGQGGFDRVGGMLVVCRRIEFLSHWAPPRHDNAPDTPRFHLPPWPSPSRRCIRSTSALAESALDPKSPR